MVFETAKKNLEKNLKNDQIISPDTDLKAEIVKGLDLRFKLPFRCLVQGSTCAGKSTLILNIIKQFDRFFPKKFDHTAYFYPVNGLTDSRKKYIEDLREHLEYLEIQEGLPKTSDMLAVFGTKMIIIDDLYFEASQSYDFLQLLIHGSHHGNTSLFITTQNLYFQGKYQKSLMRQYSDYLIFGGLSDYQLLKFLSKQIFDDKDFLVNCMKWLKTQFKYQYERYVWINLHMQTNSEEEDKFRVRANFLKTPIILQSKNIA